MFTDYIICAVFTFIVVAFAFLPYAVGRLEIALGIVCALAAAIVWPGPWLWLATAVTASHLKSL